VTHAGVDGNILVLQPGNQAVQLVTVGIVFQNDDHVEILLYHTEKDPQPVWLRV
jgi:hypothetical protein